MTETQWSQVEIAGRKDIRLPVGVRKGFTEEVVFLLNLLGQLSPTSLAPGTGFVEDNFSMDWGAAGEVGWFCDDSIALQLLCTLFLLLLRCI